MTQTEIADQVSPLNKPASELKARSKKLHPRLPQWNLESVLVKDIIGLERGTEEFLANQDLAHRIDFNLNAWEPQFWPWLLCMTPLFLQKTQKGKYFVLGSGRTLPLLRQIYAGQSSVQALVCSTRLLKEQKLAMLASDTLCILAMHRTKDGLPANLHHLWSKLQEEEGLSILRETGLKPFSQATGFAKKSLGSPSVQSRTNRKSDPTDSAPDQPPAQTEWSASDPPAPSKQHGEENT